MALDDIVVTSKFLDIATVWIIACIYDEDGNPADPTAVKINIYDPDGTKQVDAASMTQYGTETGIYEYLYHKGESADAMDKGAWRGEVIAIDGSGASAVISPQTFAFTVV